MKFLLRAIVAGSVLMSATVSAHHSAAGIDTAKELTLQGTVKEVQLTNPHSWLQVLVPVANGAATEWSVEMANPTSLIRQGFKRSSLKPGDKVTVKINPLKDGRPGGNLVSVTTASGLVLPQRLARPPDHQGAG